MIRKLLKSKPIVAALVIIALSQGSWAIMAAWADDESISVQTVTAVIDADSMTSLSGAIATVNANSGVEYVINIKDNIPMTSALTISNTAGVTIKSDMSLAGAPFTLVRSGSGFHFTVNGTLALENIVLDGNWDGSYSTSRYGGIDVYGAFYLNSGAVIQNCNCAERETAKGGGISGNAGSTIVVNGGTVRDNMKVTTNGGGGVYLTGAGSSFTMIDGEISGNTSSSSSTGYGGGISATVSSAVNISGGIISGNTAYCNGGGIYIGNGVTFNMTGGAIIGNGTLGKETSRGYGGGICVSSSSAVNINISNSTIIENTAYDSYYNSSFGGDSSGGGIYVNVTNSPENAAVIISNSIVSGNTADKGGGIYTNVPVSASGCSISGNTAVGAGSSTGHGGGIYSYTNSNVTIDGSIISGNKANGNSSSNGGGIYGYTGSRINVSGSEISGNSANQYGGGIYGYTGSNIIVSGGAINGNSAGQSGGGIYGYTGSSISVFGGVLERNSAEKNGGGIYGAGSSITVDNAAITENTAVSGHGGGIFGPAGCYIGVTDCQITGNAAPAGDGGGIYTADTGYAHVTSSDTTIYGGNRARASYFFTGTRYPAIQSASVSIPGTYVLNNYDINYIGGTLLNVYTITYDANGGQGAYQDVISGLDLEYMVLSPDKTGIAYPGHIFQGWNSEPDGNGMHYPINGTFTVSEDITLYAQWNVIVSGGAIKGIRRPYVHNQDSLIEIEDAEIPLGNIEMTEIDENQVPLTGAMPSPIPILLSCLFILGGVILRPDSRRFRGK